MGKLLWKRVYDPPEKEDGFRILADRLWPRGISKEKACLGEWAKEITPSSDLRQAYHRGEIDYETFSSLYAKELAQNPGTKDFTDKIKAELKKGNVTVLYANKDVEQSHIPVLRRFIEKALNA